MKDHQTIELIDERLISFIKGCKKTFLNRFLRVLSQLCRFVRRSSRIGVLPSKNKHTTIG